MDSLVDGQQYQLCIKFCSATFHKSINYASKGYSAWMLALSAKYLFDCLHNFYMKTSTYKNFQIQTKI